MLLTPQRFLGAAALVAWALPGAAQPPGFQPPELPEGQGKALVESVCVACHQTNLITGSAGYDAQGWSTLTAKMIALPDDVENTVAEYLAAHFPPSTARQPTLVEGDTRISIQEWDVPTLGQRPRDPLQTADGTIWWAGMYASLIGRFDPATGETREYRLAPDARPHSIVDDSDGNICTRATATARSSGSIRTPAKSPSTRCRTRTLEIRTRRSSTATATSGSRCRTPTCWAGSTRTRARSS
jgi:hypothetical protein